MVTMFDDMTKKALLRDLPVGAELYTEYYADNHKALMIKGEQDAFNYTFNLGPNGYCKFDSANVKTRGTNLSALVLRNVVEVLPELGVRSVDMFAAEVGAYLWGRAGFTPYQNEWARIVPELGERLDYILSVNKGEEVQHAAKEMRQDLTQHDPKTMWKIADRKEKLDDGNALGKAMFLAWLPEYFPDFDALTKDAPKDMQQVVNWHGELRLQDSESDDRLYEYIEAAENMLGKSALVTSIGMAPVI